MYELLNQDQGIFFDRQLEAIEAEMYQVEYAELLGKLLFDVDTSIPSGATSATYRSFDKRGKAKWINGSARDLPRVDVSGKETTFPIKIIADSYGYNVFEIEAAAQGMFPLERERAAAAFWVCEQGIDEAIFFGASEVGIPGLFDNTEIPTDDVVGGTWATKIAAGDYDLVLADINSIFTETAVETKQRESIKKLMLPTLQYNLIATTPRSATSDTTLLEYFVSKSPYLKSMDDVISVPYLAGAGAAGADIMIGYDPNPRKVQIRLPSDVQSYPAQLTGLEYEIPVAAKFGGLIVRYPMSMRRKEKI